MTDFEDRLYVSVSTSSGRNDCVMVYQKDDTWSKDTGFVGAYCVSRGKLWSGSSLDLGQVYQNEVSGVYTDNGNNYDSYWTSKINWIHPFYKTLMSELWLVAEDNTNTAFNLDYRINGSKGAYITNSLDISNTSQEWQKVPLVQGNVKALQFRIGSQQDFRINRIYLNYSPIYEVE